jgi:hypothetical protein
MSRELVETENGKTVVKNYENKVVFVFFLITFLFGPEINTSICYKSQVAVDVVVVVVSSG